jgi:hypothetical protein
MSSIQLYSQIKRTTFKQYGAVMGIWTLGHVLTGEEKNYDTTSFGPTTN